MLLSSILVLITSIVNANYIDTVKNNSIVTISINKDFIDSIGIAPINCVKNECEYENVAYRKSRNIGILTFPENLGGVELVCLNNTVCKIKKGIFSSKININFDKNKYSKGFMEKTVYYF